MQNVQYESKKTYPPRFFQLAEIFKPKFYISIVVFISTQNYKILVKYL